MDKQEVFLKEIYKHHKALQTNARYLTRDEDNAKDLLQDTYVKAYRYFDSYTENTNGKAWLNSIMHNLYLSQVKHEKENREVPIASEIYLEYLDSIDENNTCYIEDFLNKPQALFVLDDEAMKRVEIAKKILNEVPSNWKPYFIKCEFEDWDYDKIAKYYNVPIGTVRSSLHRCRKMIAEKVLKYANN